MVGVPFCESAPWMISKEDEVRVSGPKVGLGYLQRWVLKGAELPDFVLSKIFVK